MWGYQLESNPPAGYKLMASINNVSFFVVGPVSVGNEFSGRRIRSRSSGGSTIYIWECS